MPIFRVAQKITHPLSVPPLLALWAHAPYLPYPAAHAEMNEFDYAYIDCNSVQLSVMLIKVILS